MSLQTCMQTGVTNMHGHRNLHFSAWSPYRKGSMACPPIPFNPVTGHSPSHSCLCISSYQSIFFATANTPSSLSSFCGPIVSPSSYVAVDFIHSLALLYMKRLVATHKHMQFLCQYTASTTQVSGVGCLFLRSADVLW